MKAHYRMRIISSIIVNMNAGRQTVITFKTALDLIFAAWNAVRTIVIKNFFRNEKFKSANAISPDNEFLAETNVAFPSSQWEQL